MKNRKILRAGVILISVISIMLAILSKKNFKSIDLPEENFVNISMSIEIIPIDCEKTGYRKSRQ